jgi:hypothetical protein
MNLIFGHREDNLNTLLRKTELAQLDLSLAQLCPSLFILLFFSVNIKPPRPSFGFGLAIRLLLNAEIITIVVLRRCGTYFF